MATYKLTYFDFSGSRGEECRLALFLNDVDFEDNRIAVARWPELKATTPFGALPVLEVTGKPPLAQTNAILSFIGRQFGYHPTDPWEAARHEALFVAVEEYRSAVAVTGNTDDDAKKKQRREAFVRDFLQSWAGNVEQQIAGPFVAGDALHLADLKIYMVMSALLSGTYEHIEADVLDGFPKVKTVTQAVAEHPKVRQWRNR
ncbi:MAG: glutathione S-transferase family protein [Myxococcales bacterium]|nr:glutathione S-transferase family protein [Myxococcales bacterium]